MRLGALACLLVALVRGATPDLLLHATSATQSPGFETFQPSRLNAFHASSKASSPSLTWRTEVPAAGRYRIAVLGRDGSGKTVATVHAAGSRLPGVTLPRSWNRVEIGHLDLQRGKLDLELRVERPVGYPGSVHIQSVELILEARGRDEERRALEARADTSWMRKAGFGVMLHWTRESAPARGARKPYAQAVAELDVERLADQLALTGAGFAVLTTSHTHQDFPAPLRTLEAILPGRTTPRDLVKDMISALDRRGLRLMLYHHPGSGSDSAWAEACGLASGDTARHFRLWQSVVAEAGTRYGTGLAGWWFDDGATGFYPRRAPWESLHRAARAGNPGRVIGFNSWEFASVTEWQDFDCGEGLREPRGREGRLAQRDGGIYPTSSRKGQQASACVMLEDDWIHREAGRLPSAPRWTEGALSDFLGRSRETGLVPIINLEVTQEGLLGPESVEVLHKASRATRR